MSQIKNIEIDDSMLEIENPDKFSQFSQEDLFSIPLDSHIQNHPNIQQSGGDHPNIDISEKDFLGDLSEVDLNIQELPPSGGDSASPNMSDSSISYLIEQSGGFNPEGLEIDELIENDASEAQIRESGNPYNPDEDFPVADNPAFDPIEEETPEPPRWIHPELSFEDDHELVTQLNQEDIETKVNTYLENFYSEENNRYQKYLQACYSASNQKYNIRKDTLGNLYLTKRPPPPKEQKGKKTKETIQEILSDNKFTKEYLIKLTPPKYIKISTELPKVNHDLNILSGELRLLQEDLIDMGSEISESDIRRFQYLRRKFYKLINKKHIFTKYLQEVNNIDTSESSQMIYAKEMITDSDKNDLKIYKFQTHMVNASDDLINNMIIQIRDNLENYSSVINNQNTENKEEYDEMIKNFLKNKVKNQEKIQKELNGLIKMSKGKVDFLIEKLPKLDLKDDPFKL